MHRVFIDGQSGTTGLQIVDRLKVRSDIELLEIDDARRKDPAAKLEIMEQADVVILCLPDAAAIETVNLTNKVRFIDASTAHRTHPDWAYGFAELEQTARARIANTRLLSNPGCYPTGFLALTLPLVKNGLLKRTAPLVIHAISGYSGGGKQMIADYEARAREEPDNLWYSRPYALGLTHKHVPEMQHYATLENAPVFMPSVGHFQQGMLVNLPLHREFLSRSSSPEEVASILTDYYADEPCVRVMPANDDSQLQGGFLDPQANNQTNRLDLFTFGHTDQLALIARLDNLGKGASGAAVQNLNLMLGASELAGLTIDNP